jgi:hypothetical protein
MSRLEYALEAHAPYEQTCLVRAALEMPPPALHQAAAERAAARLEMQGPSLVFWSLTPWGVVTTRRVSTAALVGYVRCEVKP